MNLDGVWQDLRFMRRSCRRQPGFALTALATLTLGIGACTAIFSVVNAVVLRPVPYPYPDRIVQVGTNTGASAPKLAAWAQATDVFASLAAYRGGRVNVTTTDDLQYRVALQVSSAQADVNFFTLFGAAAVQGRAAAAGEACGGWAGSNSVGSCGAAAAAADVARRRCSSVTTGRVGAVVPLG